MAVTVPHDLSRRDFKLGPHQTNDRKEVSRMSYVVNTYTVPFSRGEDYPRSVPVAVSHPWPDENEWRADAACRTMDPAIFYPVPVGNGAAVKMARRDADPYAEARAVCASCPVADECLRFALAIRDREGMYGGTDPEERRRILRKSWDAGR